MKGYKVFNSDWTCRGFQYEVGKSYTHEGKIGLCEAGFHFCERLIDCFNYYLFSPHNKVAEIETTGSVITGDDKAVTNEIKIIKELDWHTVLDMCNSGYRNSGNCNSGNRNSGNRNSGNCNSGYRNSGNYNSGDYNSGYRNSGNYNSGDYNSGDYNSGDCNSGNRNSGNYNSGDYNSGYFNSTDNLCFAFNKILNDKEEFINSKGYKIIAANFDNSKWISFNDMTDEEKTKHPESKITGGYVKFIPYKEAWRNFWIERTEAEKRAITKMPNFDADVFYEITGIKVNECQVQNYQERIQGRHRLADQSDCTGVEGVKRE